MHSPMKKHPHSLFPGTPVHLRRDLLLDEEASGASSGEDDGGIHRLLSIGRRILRAWKWSSITILVACAIVMPCVFVASDMKAGISISDFKNVHRIPRLIPIALFWGKEIETAILCMLMLQGCFWVTESNEVYMFLTSTRTEKVRHSLYLSTMSTWAIGFTILCLEAWRIYPLVFTGHDDAPSCYQVVLGSTYAVGLSVCMFAQLIFVAYLILLWEISFQVLNEFCNSLKLDDSRTELEFKQADSSKREISDLDWLSLTEEYQEICEFLKNLWRPFTVALASLFCVLGTNIFLAIVFAYLLHGEREVTFQFVNATLCCLGILIVWFRTSTIHSKCVSLRYARESVLYLSSQYYGHSQLSEHQRNDHHRFVYCIQQRPCAVVILGVMCTKQRFFQLLTLLIKSMSVVVAFRKVVLSMESDVRGLHVLSNHTLS